MPACPLDDRQAKSHARAFRRATCPGELLEYPCPVFLGYSDAGIPYLYAHGIARQPATDQHTTALRILNGVHDKVLDAAHQVALIAADPS